MLMYLQIVGVVVGFLFITACYVIWNLTKKTELLETWVENFTQMIETIQRELNEIDAKGSFEADDETGFFFEQLKSVQKLLSDIFEEEKEKIDLNIIEHILRFAMGVQSISGSFSRNEGIMLPGFAQTSRYGGFDENLDSPGLLFLVGHQNTDVFGNKTSDFAVDAAENGWLVQQPYLNQQYTESFTENFNVRMNLEPIKHFKIELTANRSTSRNNQSFFRYDEDGAHSNRFFKRKTRIARSESGGDPRIRRDSKTCSVGWKRKSHGNDSFCWNDWCRRGR